MKWTQLPNYQKLFICSIGIMILYLLASRILGIWLDPDLINFPKILRFVMGLLFICSVVFIYILPKKKKN